MKNILLFASALLFFGCSSDDGNNATSQNKVLLLKVDFKTNAFEGGKELLFDETSNNFTISADYQTPADFGSVTLKYQEQDKKIFDGTIVWLGTGERSYPQDITPPSAFNTIPNPLPIPGLDSFKKVQYYQFAYYPETIDYVSIWNAIDNLSLVSEYRNSNPNSKINLFLYTPSVGIGNPEEWDWYVILKN